MNIDKAIKHCEDIAKSCENKMCSQDHHQLAEWLKELKQLRNIVKQNGYKRHQKSTRMAERP